MARLSFGYNYNPGFISAGGEGSALHTDFAASAPFVGVGANQYTLGAIYQFGAGTTQRTYFTLQHNTSTMEILVCWCDGVDAAYSSTAPIEKRDTGYDGQQQQLWIAYSPGGGFETNLGGDDPVNLSFWPADSTLAIPSPWCREGQTVNMWFLADDARAELHVFLRTASNFWGFCAAGDELVDNGYDNVTVPNTYGYMYFWTDTAAPPPDILGDFDFGYFNGTSFVAIGNNYPQNLNILEGAVDANQPDGATKFITAKMPLINNSGIFGHWNTQMYRLAGRTNADTYGLKRGTDINYQLIHLASDIYLPWDDNLAVP